jgi:hypothetical protein
MEINPASCHNAAINTLQFITIWGMSCDSYVQNLKVFLQKPQMVERVTAQ